MIMDGVIKERKDDYELNITKTLESNLYMYLKIDWILPAQLPSLNWKHV